MHDARGEERESKEGWRGGVRRWGMFDWTVRPQWKLFHDPVRPFPHDVAGIFGRDPRTRYLSPRNMAHPGRPGSPVYLETAPRYSPPTCPPSPVSPFSAIRPHDEPGTFLKYYTLEGREDALLHPFPSLPVIRFGLFLVSIFPVALPVRRSFASHSLLSIPP